MTAAQTFAIIPCSSGEGRQVTGRRTLAGLAAVLAAVGVTAAACGGSSGPPASVNGCDIQPATSCPNADLSGANLDGADLTKADLSGADLTDASLKSADLTEANLSNATIANADLDDADLTSADLTGAQITGTSLDGAYLCGTTRTDGTVDDSSCPASQAATTPTTSTDTTSTETTPATTGQARATVTSFTVGTLTCASGAAQGPVEASWQTQAATAVELAVDGQPPGASAGFGPSGSATLQVPCDAKSHDVSVTALSDAGPGQTVTKQVGPG